MATMADLAGVLMLPGARSTAQGDADAQRVARYADYLRFYEGDQWPDAARAGERRLTVNYARVFIQKQASYLLGRGVRVEAMGSGLDSPAYSPLDINRMLDEMHRANSLDRTDFEVALDAAVLGDGVFKITRQAGRVVVAQVDPFDLAADWHDDWRTPRRVIQRHTLPVEDARAAFGLTADEIAACVPDRRGRVTLFETWTAARLVLTTVLRPDLDPFGRGGAHLAEPTIIRDTPNPYAFVPYLIFPNTPRPRYQWGESDLADLMELNRELNARLSVLSQILHLSGNPVLVLEGVDEAERTIRVGPGAVWTLPPDSRAYLLDMLEKGGVGLHIEYIQQIYRALHDVAEMPRSAFGDQSGRVAASGVSLEFDIQPLVRKIDRKRLIWEYVLIERARMMLRLSGVAPEEVAALALRVIWPPLLPQDTAQDVANAVALVGAGIVTAAEAKADMKGEF